MCRSIKRLRNAEQLPTDEEISAAALQFVRKVSGYRVPSRVNQPAFDYAIAEIAASTRMLLTKLESPNTNLQSPPHSPSQRSSSRKDIARQARVSAQSR